MKDKAPKIHALYKAIEIIGREVHFKLPTEDGNGDSEYYWVDPDPGVTETMTCTDMVCSTSEAKFLGPVQSFQTRLVLPVGGKFADEVNIKVRTAKAKNS